MEMEIFSAEIMDVVFVLFIFGEYISVFLWTFQHFLCHMNKKKKMLQMEMCYLDRKRRKNRTEIITVIIREERLCTRNGMEKRSQYSKSNIFCVLSNLNRAHMCHSLCFYTVLWQHTIISNCLYICPAFENWKTTKSQKPIKINCFHLQIFLKCSFPYRQ